MCAPPNFFERTYVGWIEFVGIEPKGVRITADEFIMVNNGARGIPRMFLTRRCRLRKEFVAP
jgi:hypothetical protein